MSLDYLGGPNVIMRIFISERKPGGRGRELKGKGRERSNKKRERWGRRRGRRGRKRERVDDATLLALKMKDGATSQGRQETGKAKKTDSHLEPPEGMHLCWHLDFSLEYISSREHVGYMPSRTHDPQNYKVRNLCCFKPLSFWQFVTTAIDNY